MTNAPSGAFALDPDHVGLTVAPEPRCEGQGVGLGAMVDACRARMPIPLAVHGWLVHGPPRSGVCFPAATMFTQCRLCWPRPKTDSSNAVGGPACCAASIVPPTLGFGMSSAGGFLSV